MPDKQTIDGITVEIGEKYKGCDTLFYSIKPVGKASMGPFRKAVKDAYKGNSVRVMSNPSLAQIVAIAKTVTAAGFSCKVEAYWGFYV